MINMMDISSIKIKVKDELKKSYAPVTGYYLACAIITENGVYIDHNFEHESSLRFEHVEYRALKKVLRKEVTPRISRIIMYGRGKVKKFKHYVPCCFCCELLRPYTTRGTTVYLMRLEKSNKSLSLNFDELVRSYKTLTYSRVGSPDAKKTKAALKHSTILNKKDRDFLLDLILLGRRRGVTFYLTGSSSGRGGVSTFLIHKLGISYKDIDLICVLNRKTDCKGIQKDVEGIVKKHYGLLSKVIRDIPKYQNIQGVIISKVYYHFDSDPEPFIDLTYSSKLEGSFIKEEYNTRNWFYELV